MELRFHASKSAAVWSNWNEQIVKGKPEWMTTSAILVITSDLSAAQYFHYREDTLILTTINTSTDVTRVLIFQAYCNTEATLNHIKNVGC
jgi:hypothetical protein